jgi:hypothetical protein
MLTRDVRRIALIVVPLMLLFYVTLSFYQPAYRPQRVNDWIVSGKTDPTSTSTSPADDGSNAPAHPHTSYLPATNLDDDDIYDADDDGGSPLPTNFPGLPGGQDSPKAEEETGLTESGSGSGSPLDPDAYQEIFSLTTANKKYFFIDFGDKEAINPNLIPHPTASDTWIIVAQYDKDEMGANAPIVFEELICLAVFEDGVLRCVRSATVLPVKDTPGGNCKDKLKWFNLSHGPHDARVFWGPEKPYIVFGSNSQYTCFGLYIQDFRMLVQDGPNGGYDLTGSTMDSLAQAPQDDSWFREATEMKRPLPWGPVEKNWFPFWDPEGNMYVHYDVAPRRVFAKIDDTGSIGPDLAPQALGTDEKCLAKYMPSVAPENESVHQSTNSLRITMCKRADPACTVTADNTFIMAIFQFKSYYSFHGVYEPYVMLFHEQAPFEVRGISRKPLWIHGREAVPDRNTTDMLYVTSMSWKQHGSRYHGYLDDEMFIGFGVEDERPAAVDLLASSLVEGIGLCDE